VIPAAAEPPPDARPAGDSAPNVQVSDQQIQESIQWLSDMALSELPPTYSGDKDWGRKKRLWAGVEIKREGLKLRTHRKWREVNHGHWFRYEILPRGHRPAQPSPRNAPLPVTLKINNVRREGDRWLVDATATAPVDFTTQLQRWNLGVKWYSVSTQGDMRVRIDATIGIRFTADYSEVPPALVIAPAVIESELTLESFDIRRVSKVGGEVAEEIGVIVERNLNRYWLDKLNDKLVDKLNHSIDKYRDDLRFSLTAYLTGWNR